MMYTGKELFSFPMWYPIFNNDAGEAIIVEVPEEVLEYLHGRSGEISRSSSEEDLSRDWGVDVYYMPDPPKFTCFNKKLKNALNCLGGSAFLKSNWHSAIDAPFDMELLKCTCIEDVYMLLSKSETLNKDMRYEFKSNISPIQHCIVLKEWLDVRPGHEFRCFVKNGSLIGISQRDCSSFYGFVSHNRYVIMRKIIDFFQEKIREFFLAPNYVVDILMQTLEFIQILDFQQFNEESTEGLLFKWEELCDWVPRVDMSGLSPDAPDFRFIGLS